MIRQPFNTSGSAYEQAVIDYINSSLYLKKGASGRAVAYPNDPAAYFLKDKVGEVLVRYMGCDYQEADAALRAQQRKVYMELVLVYRQLHHTQGIYTVAAVLARHLLGYRVNDAAGGIVFDKEELLGEHQGIWQWRMSCYFTDYLIRDERILEP